MSTARDSVLPSLAALEQLPAPPRLAKGTLRVTALGGLGDIGRNMAVLEYDGALLVVDCGVLFPEVDQPGVDLILPDFGPIRDRLDDVVGVVLTHGHEDHIGGVPYLLAEKSDIPLIGSRFTLAIVEEKLKERRIKPYTLQVVEGDTETVGPFGLEFFAVNHSIPDALAVAVRTPAGLVLHTGDIKLDQIPLDGRVTDLAGFARLADEGLDLLMIDSTNADVPGFVTPERDIGPVLERLVGQATGKVVVASFASHVHRVQQVLDAAVAHDRKVAFVGRSMVRNMGLAKDLGLLRVPDGLLVDARKIDDLPDEKVLLMSTGSQGEPLSALARMARGQHPVVVGEGDLVVLASSMVPGNETDVFRVINGLSALGCTVVHKGVAPVHVSGHSPAGELLLLLNLLEPENVLPVHGEPRHLREVGRLARMTGVEPEGCVVVTDGVCVDLRDGAATVAGRVPTPYVYVHGTSVGEVDDQTLRDRRALGDEGFLGVTAVVDLERRSLVAGPVLTARGFTGSDALLEELRPRVASALTDALADSDDDAQALQQRLRRTVGRWVSDDRRRPVLVPQVLTVSGQGGGRR